MKTASRIAAEGLNTIRDIRHSCEVLDGKRPAADHRRNNPIDDVFEMMGIRKPTAAK